MTARPHPWGDDLEHAGIEVGLQCVVVFQFVGFHEGEDMWVRLPVGSGRFVSTNVNVGVRKDGRHLRQEAANESIGLLACGIDGVIADTELASDLVGNASTGELWVGNEPGGAVPRHFKFRHDSNAACARIGHNLPGVLLCIEEPVGSPGGKLGIDAALHAEALVLCEMPVKDVELDGCHAVKGAFDNGDRLEVATAVYHQAAPPKTRGIVNGNCGNHVAAAIRLDELDQGF
jgi:hypothetical protein